MDYIVTNRTNGQEFKIHVNDIMAFDVFIRTHGFVKHMGEYIGANYAIKRTND